MGIPAIIIARGGSRRLPRKNTMKLCGRPLVEWSIIQAQNSHEISSVWLSSDDEEIRDIGSRVGANVICEEPFTGSGERPPGRHAILKALEVMQNAGVNIDVFIDILGSGVLWKPDDFDKGIRLFFDTKAEAVAPKYNPRECYVSKKLPDGTIYRVLFSKTFDYFLNGEQWGVEKFDNYRIRDSSMPATDKENDAFLIHCPQPSWDIFPRPYLIEQWQICDIDDEKDFEICEIFMRKFILESLGKDCYKRYGKGKHAD